MIKRFKYKELDYGKYLYYYDFSNNNTQTLNKEIYYLACFMYHEHKIPKDLVKKLIRVKYAKFENIGVAELSFYAEKKIDEIVNKAIKKNCYQLYAISIWQYEIDLINDILNDLKHKDIYEKEDILMLVGLIVLSKIKADKHKNCNEKELNIQFYKKELREITGLSNVIIDRLLHKFYTCAIIDLKHVYSIYLSFLDNREDYKKKCKKNKQAIKIITFSPITPYVYKYFNIRGVYKICEKCNIEIYGKPQAKHLKYCEDCK